MTAQRTSEWICYFSSPIEKVFEIVCDNQHTAWRSDLDHVEVIDELHFIEYTKQNQATTFTITDKVEHTYYAFTMENAMFHGTWTGTFSQEDGRTKIVFTEHIFVHNPILRILSYLFMNLKKMQKQYTDDLKKELGEPL